MKLIYPKEMTLKRTESLHLCIARSGLRPSLDEVREALTMQICTVEAGIEIIDNDLPIPGIGKIDIVARDNRGCPVLVKLDSFLDAKSIADLLRQSDWMIENKMVLEHFYPDQNFGGNIRLWYFVEEILPEAKSLLSHLDRNVCIKTFTYSCLLLSGGKWLVVQPFGVEARNKRQEARSRKQEAGNRASCFLPPSSELTQEEIDDFLSEDGHLQAGGGTVEEEDEITYVGPYFR